MRKTDIRWIGSEEKFIEMHDVLRKFTAIPRFNVDHVLLTLSSLALVPFIGLLFFSDHIRRWPELRYDQRQPVAASNPPGQNRSKPAAIPPAASRKSSTPTAVPLDDLMSRVVPFWPSASSHGRLNDFLANGIVRAAIYAPNELPPPSRDFWTSVCADPVVHCVILLPNTASVSAESSNTAVIFLDPATTATMPPGAFALVYDRQGRCVFAAQYHDLTQLHTELRLMTPVIAAASAPVTPMPGAPAQSPAPVLSTQTQPAPPVSPPVAVSPSGASAPTRPPATTKNDKPVQATAHPEKPGLPSAPNRSPPAPNLASLDARLQPLFAEGRTSLLQLAAIQKARADAKPVVLCFWATYCRACVEELGELSQMRAENPDAVFVGLMQDSSMDEIRQIARNMVPASFQAHYILSDALLQKQIFHAIEIPLPAFVIFDGRGRMKDAFFGSLLADPKNRERLLSQLPAKE